MMPLVALISDALLKVKELLPQVPAVHLIKSTIQEAKAAALIFTSPESIIDGCGRTLLQIPEVVDNLKAVFIDEFHIISAW